jgi:hypothetical protein
MLKWIYAVAVLFAIAAVVYYLDQPYTVLEMSMEEICARGEKALDSGTWSLCTGQVDDYN